MYAFPRTRPFALLGCLLLATSAWGEPQAAERFHYDPVLTGELLLPAHGPTARSVVIEAAPIEGGVRLATETPVAPYLEAVREQEPTADELRLLPDGYERAPLERYQLGVGVGIAVEDRASLSLGYRFHQPLSLLDEQRRDLTDPRGDLRVFFDVKLPFD
jgi:hypothetical protein